VRKELKELFVPIRLKWRVGRREARLSAPRCCLFVQGCDMMASDCDLMQRLQAMLVPEPSQKGWAAMLMVSDGEIQKCWPAVNALWCK